MLYVAPTASVGAFICWNRGVAVVGANAAEFTMHLLPAYGTLLAIALLGETFTGFDAAGFSFIDRPCFISGILRSDLVYQKSGGSTWELALGAISAGPLPIF